MVIAQHRLVENSRSGELGAAGSQEPWAAPDENTGVFNCSSDITEPATAIARAVWIIPSVKS